MPKRKVGPLRCLLCNERYEEEDVANKNYFAETSTCFNCYRRLAKSPFIGPKGTCFGKLSKVSEETGKILYFGYDPLAEDCSIHCPHKHICPQFATKKIYKERQFLITPFEGETAEVMRQLLRGVTRRKGKKLLSDSGVRRMLLRGFYEGKRWFIDRTSKVYKAYWVQVRKK